MPKVRRRFVRADIIELLQHRVVPARWRLKRIHLRGIREERHAALTADMLAVTPREADGSYAIPFGAIYLTATN